MARATYNKKLLLLLADGFELIETSGYTDVMAWASFQDHVNIEVVSAASTPSVKTAFGGLTVTPNALLSDLDLDLFDALAIPGGMEWAGFFEAAYSEDFKQTIQHFAGRGEPLSAVCVASLALGHADALKGRKASIYHSKTGKHAATLQAQGAVFLDQPVVRDGNITTSSGPGTAVEIAFELLGDLTDADVVQETRAMMRVPSPQPEWRRPQVETGSAS